MFYLYIYFVFCEFEEKLSSGFNSTTILHNVSKNLKSLSLKTVLTESSPHMTMIMPMVTDNRQIMGAQAILPKSNGPIKKL